MLKKMWKPIDEFVRDARQSLRFLARSPIFTAVALLSLALGIGATTTVFTLANAIVLRMMPVERPDQLVQVNRTGPGGAGPVVSYPAYELLRESTGFEGMIASNWVSQWSVSWGDGPTERSEVELVSQNYFSVLGLTPTLGSLSLDPGTAVISHGYWTRRLHGDPSVVGKPLSINGAEVIVAGVSPAGFAGIRSGEAAEIWLPLSMQPRVMGGQSILSSAGDNWLRVLGRLAPGVSLPQATDRANAIFTNHLLQRAGGMTGASRANFLAERIELVEGGFGLSGLRDRYDQPLLVLLCASLLALLITCANLAHLLLERATRRSREIALRLALGAGRLRVARQLLTESVVLAAIGGALGALLAVWGSLALARITLPDASPESLVLQPDWRVLAFTTSVALLTGMLFGLAPAIQAARADLTEAVKEAAVHRRSSFRRALVVSQVSMALALVSVAGLFAKSMWNLRSTDPGFDQARVILARLDCRGLSGSTSSSNVLRAVKNRLENVPGIKFASLSSRSYFGAGENQRTISVKDYVAAPGADLNPFVMTVSAGFFETMGVRLIAGRPMARQDEEPESAKAAVVSQSFARYYFGAATPLGKTFGFGGDSASSAIEIVGVVADTKDGHVKEQPRHIVYVPFLASDSPLEVALAVKAVGNPEALIPAIRSAIHETNPSIAVVSVRTLSSQIDRSLGSEKMLATLSSFFAALALLLASVGLYGVLAYGVTMRTKEFAVRMALGARTSDIQLLVARDTIWTLGVGLSCGLLLALIAGRMAAALLYGISPYDVTTVLTAAGVTGVAAFLASWGPVRTAAATDPAIGLLDQ